MGTSGIEPPTSRLSGVRSNRLSYKPSVVSDARKFLSGWRRRDSNSRPPACKAGALPTELHPHGCGSSLFQGYPYILFLWTLRPMGLSGLEPPTSRLSGVRSNRLSYKPSVVSDARKFSFRMETKRFELSTPCLQGRCSPN